MANHHARSNSFPSQQYPLVQEFEEQLRRLRSSHEASSSSTSLTSKLGGVRDLYDCTDTLLLLPLNQQALTKEQNIDEYMDRSLRVLDLCNTTKDSLTQMKESIQEILSILRRRRAGDEISLGSEVNKFSAARKMAKKSLNKAMGNGCKSQETSGIAGVLREVESITLNTFESLISFISGPKSQKSSRWSLISKMIGNSKRVACESILCKSNEFERADAELDVLVLQKTKKSDLCKEKAQNELKKLEICIRDLEEGLESLYRRLLKSRVSLLNIFNH